MEGNPVVTVLKQSFLYVEDDASSRHLIRDFHGDGIGLYSNYRLWEQ